MYRQTVTIRNRGETEVLNVMYEPETWDGSYEELTTESGSEIVEASGKRDYSAFVLTLKEDRFPITEVKETEATQEKSLTCERNTQLMSNGYSIVTQM